MSRQSMIQNTRVLLYFFTLLIVSGCGDNRYLSEKMLYQTEKKVSVLVKQRSGKLEDKDYETVIQWYRKVAETFPFELTSAQIRLTISNIYASQQKYDPALSELKAIIQNFSSQPSIAANAQLAIARLFERQGKYQQALAEYEKIKDLYPMTKLGLEMPLFLTQYYDKKNDQDKESRAYRSAVRHYKRFIDDYANTSQESFFQDYLVRTYVQGNEIDKAVEVLDDISEKNPQTPAAVKAVSAKAEIYALKLKDIPRAISVYEEYVKQNPQSEYAKEMRYRVGDLYFVNNQITEAYQAFSSLLKEYPQDKGIAVRSLFGLAACYMKQGLSDKVLRVYEEVMKKYPDDPAALSIPYLTYRYHLQLKDTANADVSLLKAVAEYENKFRETKRGTQDHLMASRFLFICYAAKKDWDRSLKLLRTLSRDYPQDPGFLMTMASIQVKVLKNNPEAVKIYKEVIEKYPTQKKLISRIQKEIDDLESDRSGKSAGN